MSHRQGYMQDSLRSALQRAEAAMTQQGEQKSSLEELATPQGQCYKHSVTGCWHPAGHREINGRVGDMGHNLGDSVRPDIPIIFKVSPLGGCNGEMLVSTANHIYQHVTELETS